MVGPEAGLPFAVWKDSVPPYQFANWGGIEPNHSEDEENYLVFNVGLNFAEIATGEWWDAVPVPWGLDPVVGYLVEYEPVTPRPASLNISVASFDSGVVLTFFAAAHKTYQVQYSQKVGHSDWVDLGMPVGGDDAITAVVDPTTDTSKRFYRLKIQQ
jgi:hypothetical protein